jgi:hypothetical protein
MRGRAVENRVFAACTSNDGLACVFNRNGRALELSSKNERTFLGNERAVLYCADLSTTRTDALAERLDASPVRREEGVSLKIRGDQLRMGHSRTSWCGEGQLGPYLVACIGEREWRDPCRWVEPFIRNEDRTLFWVRVSTSRLPAAVSVALAKSVELCSPVLIEPDLGEPLLVELANNYKATRTVRPPRVAPRFNDPLKSSFMIAAGSEEGRSAWKRSVAPYASLLNSCRDSRKR